MIYDPEREYKKKIKSGNESSRPRLYLHLQLLQETHRLLAELPPPPPLLPLLLPLLHRDCFKNEMEYTLTDTKTTISDHYHWKNIT